MRPIVCMITPVVTPEPVAALVSRIEQGARAGLDLVQIRRPDLDARTLRDFVAEAVAAVRGFPTRIVVNERLDVALAAGAHGVHLREDSTPAARARGLTPRGFLFGRSVHSIEAARQATRESVDYLVFGTVYPTASKPSVNAVGVEALSQAAGATPLPVLAIGGVTLERLEPLARAGAAGIAAIGLFAHGDIGKAVADVKRRWALS